MNAQQLAMLAEAGSLLAWAKFAAEYPQLAETPGVKAAFQHGFAVGGVWACTQVQELKA